MSKVVIYTNSNGFKELRKVPNGTLPADYSKGILLGPPDLDELAITKKQKLKLNNALVEIGFASYKDIGARRADLIRIIQDVLAFNATQARELRNQVLLIYQKEAYPEIFETSEE